MEEIEDNEVVINSLVLNNDLDNIVLNDINEDLYNGEDEDYYNETSEFGY